MFYRYNTYMDSKTNIIKQVAQATLFVAITFMPMWLYFATMKP